VLDKIGVKEGMIPDAYLSHHPKHLSYLHLSARVRPHFYYPPNRSVVCGPYHIGSYSIGQYPSKGRSEPLFFLEVHSVPVKLSFELAIASLDLLYEDQEGLSYFGYIGRDPYSQFARPNIAQAFLTNRNTGPVPDKLMCEDPTNVKKREGVTCVFDDASVL